MQHPSNRAQDKPIPYVPPGYFSPAEPPPAATAPPQQTPPQPAASLPAPPRPAPLPHQQAHFSGQHRQYAQPLPPAQPHSHLQNPVPSWEQPLHSATFIQAMGQFFRKYGTFSGRASRREFWFVALFMVGLAFAGSLFNAVTGSDWGAGFFVMFMLATIVPSLAVAVRRLHDANFSGALLWLWLVPYVGFLIVLVLAAMPSNPAGARYDKVQPFRHTQGR